jgi:BirA family biotin operon repressor/biotin-[acetyl-CoA-carboxylase] ligase
LRIALQEEVAREPLLISLLECVDEFCALLMEQGPTAILRAFANASSYVLHRRVIYETDLGSRKGVTAGLDNNGFLKVRNDSGIVETLYTGGVRPDTGRPL